MVMPCSFGISTHWYDYGVLIHLAIWCAKGLTWFILELGGFSRFLFVFVCLFDCLFIYLFFYSLVSWRFLCTGGTGVPCVQSSSWGWRTSWTTNVMACASTWSLKELCLLRYHHVCLYTHTHTYTLSCLNIAWQTLQNVSSCWCLLYFFSAFPHRLHFSIQSLRGGRNYKGKRKSSQNSKVGS